MDHLRGLCRSTQAVLEAGLEYAGRPAGRAAIRRGQQQLVALGRALLEPRTASWCWTSRVPPSIPGLRAEPAGNGVAGGGEGAIGGGRHPRHGPGARAASASCSCGTACGDGRRPLARRLRQDNAGVQSVACSTVPSPSDGRPGMTLEQRYEALTPGAGAGRQLAARAAAPPWPRACEEESIRRRVSPSSGSASRADRVFRALRGHCWRCTQLGRAEPLRRLEPGALLGELAFFAEGGTDGERCGRWGRLPAAVAAVRELPGLPAAPSGKPVRR